MCFAKSSELGKSVTTQLGVSYVFIGLFCLVASCRVKINVVLSGVYPRNMSSRESGQNVSVHFLFTTTCKVAYLKITQKAGWHTFSTKNVKNVKKTLKWYLPGMLGTWSFKLPIFVVPDFRKHRNKFPSTNRFRVLSSLIIFFTVFIFN